MVWTKIKESLKETLADNVFHLWIEPLQFEQFQGDRFYLSSPDRYFSAYVKQNFSSMIEDRLRENGLQAAQLVFCEKSREVPLPFVFGKTCCQNPDAPAECSRKQFEIPGASSSLYL